MKKFDALLLGIIACLTWSTQSGAVEFTKTATGVEATDAIQTQAKVLSINKKKRELKLKTSDGEETTVIVGEEVKNFAQIKKGDLIKINYLESLVLDLKKGGGPAVAATESANIKTAEPGQKPAVVAESTMQSRGTVTSVDKTKQTITVAGPNGKVSLHVKRKDLFDQIKTGDQIEATYKEAMAISVESVKK